MSKAAVIVALILAIGLGVAALLFNKGGGSPVAEGPLLTFDPATAAEMRMDYADGSMQAVQRTGSEWRIELKSKEGQSRTWPAATTQVHAALRILANLIPEQPAEGTVTNPAGTLTVIGEGSPQVLAIGGQRLGGRVLVQAGKRTAMVDAAIAEMLIDTGIRAWRSPAALPGVGAEASRISIRGHAGGGVVLARVQGRWALREPLAEPADPDAIARLLGMLGAVRIDDFCDNGPPADSGLDAPVATLSVETDSRDANGRMVTIRQTVSVGRAADVAGRTVVARLERSGDSGFAETVILIGEQLAAISADPLQYVSRRALQIDPAEVGQLAIKRTHVGGGGGVVGACVDTGFRRTLDGWETRCGEESWRVASADEVKLITGLVDLLTSTPAETLTVRESANTEQPSAAVIEVSSLGGTLIARVELDVEATRLASMSERVRRHYPAGVASPIAEWIGRR